MSSETREIKERIKKEKQRRRNMGYSDELTKAEKNRIAQRVHRKYKVRKMRIGILAALGLGAVTTIGGNKLLDAGKNEQKTKVENNQDNQTTFKNGLKTTVNAQEIENQVEEIEIENSINEDINKFNSKEDVLKYIKQYYVEAYNEDNNAQISTEDIKLYRTTEMKNMYKSQANNQENIIRYRSSTNAENKLETSSGLLQVRIDTNGENKVESVTKYNDKYVKVYDYNENVEEYNDDTTLSKVAEIIDTGIRYADAIELPEEQTAYTVKLNYKNNLVNAIKNYEINKDKGYEFGE